MKRLVYSQVAGRREGETPVYKFDYVKAGTAVVVAVVTALVIGWGTYVTKWSIAGDAAKKTVDVQVPVLHGRITGQEAKRTNAVNTITKKIDSNQAAQTIQYQQIMNQLLEMQRDINK